MQYKETCAIAYPNFKQLIHLLSNHDEKFSEEKLLTFNVNDNIFKDHEIDYTVELKNELHCQGPYKNVGFGSLKM